MKHSINHAINHAINQQPTITENDYDAEDIFFDICKVAIGLLLLGSVASVFFS